MNLLNSHKVHLVGDTGFYLIHMHEEARNNNDVCCRDRTNRPYQIVA